MIRRGQGKVGRILLAAILYSCVTRPACAEKKELQEIKQAETQEKKPSAVALPVLPQIKYEADALRDPFPPPPEKKAIQKVDVQDKQSETIKPVDITPPSLTIQGIIWGGVLPQAVINGKVVKVGDTIEEAKITNISKDGIEIVFKNQTFHLVSPSIAQREQLEQRAKGGPGEK